MQTIHSLRIWSLQMICPCLPGLSSRWYFYCNADDAACTIPSPLHFRFQATYPWHQDPPSSHSYEHHAAQTRHHSVNPTTTSAIPPLHRPCSMYRQPTPSMVSYTNLHDPEQQYRKTSSTFGIQCQKSAQSCDSESHPRASYLQHPTKSLSSSHKKTGLIISYHGEMVINLRHDEVSDHDDSK